MNNKKSLVDLKNFFLIEKFPHLDFWLAKDRSTIESYHPLQTAYFHKHLLRSFQSVKSFLLATIYFVHINWQVGCHLPDTPKVDHGRGQHLLSTRHDN